LGAARQLRHGPADVGPLVQVDLNDADAGVAVGFDPADVVDEGRALVSGRLLADICRSLPGKPVDVTTGGSKASLTCGTSRFALPTMPVEEYPALPAMPAVVGTIPGEEFVRAVQQVAVATSRDETLPILTGVRIELEGDQLTLLGTDRYRLAMRTLTWHPEDPELTAAALIRARTLTEVAKTLTGGADVTLALASGSSPGDAAGSGGGTGGAGMIGFEAGGRQATSLLVEGQYPNVRNIFPSSVDVYAVVDTQALMATVRRVALVAERNTPVRLAFTPGLLVLAAGQGENAQASEGLECTLVGEELSIALNPNFLLDGLGALNSPLARLSFTEPTKPVTLSPQSESDGPDDPSYRYTLGPVRVGG